MPAQLIHFSALTPRGRRRCGIVVVLNSLIAQLRLKPPLEIERRQIQLRQLGSQQVEIPRTLVGLVVHKTQGVHLLRRQIIDADAGHLNHAQLLRRQGAAVADDDHAVPVYHDRLDESILPDALCHVGHLAGIVLLCIGGIGDDIRESPHLNLHTPLLSVPESDTVCSAALRDGRTSRPNRGKRRRVLQGLPAPQNRGSFWNCPAILAPTRCAAPRRRGNRWNVLDPHE